MSPLADSLGACAAFSERHPRSIVLVCVALALLSAFSAARYARIDSDLSALIRPSGALRWYRHDLDFKAAFPERLQTAVVVVSGADGAAVDTAAARLESALRGLPALEFVFAPSRSAFLRDHRLYYLDPDTLSAWRDGVEYGYGVLLRLSDEASLANAAFTFADQVAARPRLPLPAALASLAESFRGAGPPQLSLRAYPHLTDERGTDHYQLLVVKGEQRLDEALPNARLVALLRDTIAAQPRTPGVRMRLTGEIPLAHEEIDAALSGIGIAGSISLLLLLAILGIGVRSLRTTLAVFALLFTGIALTLGWATIAVGSFNTLALIFVVMFFGLGVDFAVHFALRLREAAAGHGNAARTAARDIGPALALCMLTTSLAFLAFTPTAYRGLAELGVISAGGMVIALGLSLTLLPALFRILNVRSGPLPDQPLGFGALPPKAVLAVTGLLACAAVPAALQLRFDYSVLAMRDTNTEAMSTLLELQRAGITTDYSISVLVEPAAAATTAARLRGLAPVGDVFTPTALVPPNQAATAAQLRALDRLLDTIEGVEPAPETTPLPAAIAALEAVSEQLRDQDRPDHAALVDGLRRVAEDPRERQRLNDALRDQLQQELDALRRLLRAAPFTFADLPAALRKRFVAPDGRVLLSVEPEVPLVDRQQTEAFIEAVATAAPNYAGRAVVEWGVGDVVVRAFLQAAALAVTLITALLLVYFRSLRLTLCVLTPLLLATLFTFAAAGLGSLSLNMANVLVVPLIFGLGVDTGIHVVDRFRGVGSVDRVLASSTSRAVLISGLTTIGTFFSLIFSPHKGAASVGLLLFVAISALLLCTFVVLPALLQTLPRARPARVPGAT